MSSDRDKFRVVTSDPQFGTKPSFRMDVSPSPHVDTQIPDSTSATPIAAPSTPATPIPQTQYNFIPYTPQPGRAPSQSYATQSPALSGFMPHPIYAQPYSPIYTFHPPPQRKMVETGTQTMAEAPGVQLALNFTSNLFDGVIPGTEAGGRQRKKFSWPKNMEITPEDRLLVILRAIKRAGFPTLGSFLFQVFQNDFVYNKHPTVYHTIAAFLQAKEHSVANHPIAIIDLIFRHRKSQEYVDGVPVEPNFVLPRYALPPSSRANPVLPIHCPNTTYNAMVNWALHRMIERFQKETKALLNPSRGFVHRPADPPLTWDYFLRWSMSLNQETIALHGTAIFTLFTSIAVNESARAKLEAQVAAVAEEFDGLTDDGLPFFSESPEDPNPTSVPDTILDDEQDGDDDPDSMDDSESPEPKLFTDPVGRRDPWQAVTAVILVLLAFRNRYALIFPLMIGIFAFTCHANRELISVLCRLGISVSYKMVLAQLHVLGADSAAQLQLLGAFDPETGPMFLLLFDNVNKMKRAWRASLGHKDEVKSGTASTVIRLVGVRPGAFLSEPLNKAIAEGKRGELTVKRLRDDIDWTHIRGVGVGLVLRIWLKYIVFLTCHRAAVEELFKSKHRKHILQLRKSDILSTRLTSIDESTTVGVASVLWNLIIGQLCIIPTALYRWLVMICGDQLSIDRIRKLKEYTRKYGNPFQRHEWALPVIQLWHLKWNWQKAIFRLHWHPNLGKDIFGLHHDCEFLERSKFNHEKCDFYPAHHILEDRFETIILEALRLVCQEETGIEYGPEVKLVDAVSKYFGPEGQLYECSFERLQNLAEKVYTRYMTTAAAEDALGHSPRDPAIYGSPWNANVDVDMESEETQAMPSLAPIGSAPTKPPPKKKSRAKASAKPARNFSGGDQVLVTLCNFMRVTFWYLELCAAIAEGDIGRVFEIIKVLRFSFWGAGSTNYGNELLELACNFLYEWSDDLRFTVLENYLANPTGRIGHWLELDLLQEHFNFWIKNLFNSKSHDFDGKHLSEAVGLNITGISKLRERFPGLFGLKKNGQKHRKVSVVDDINRLGAHFRKEHILEWESGRDQPYVVGNEFAEGAHVLSSGTLKAFLERTMRDGSVQVDDVTSGDEDGEAPDGPEVPPCPATLIEGVMDVDEFISGVPPS